MAKYKISLNLTFAALSHQTRRDILKRLAAATNSLTIQELAKPYGKSLPTISRHLSVLEKAGIVKKHKMGREVWVRLFPEPIQVATWYLRQQESEWKTHSTKLKNLLPKPNVEKIPHS